MHFFYIDESADEQLFILAALAVPAPQWRTTFDKVRAYRLELQHTEGIDIHAEFHAWKFVSGRGNIASSVVTKGRRCQIFKNTLQMMTTLPEVKLITTVTSANQEEAGFEHLLIKIQQWMESEKSYAILICDQGKETAYRRYARALQANGSINTILEEPWFKDSAQSYLIQLSDFCAYALLRQEHPLASKTKYGLDQAFKILSPIILQDEKQQTMLDL